MWFLLLWQVSLCLPDKVLVAPFGQFSVNLIFIYPLFMRKTSFLAAKVLLNISSFVTTNTKHCAIRFS
jgi:hypothetical protein